MMLIPDSHRNLAAAPVVASLSTVGTDGTPQVTAVWFLSAGDTIKFSLTSERQKSKSMISRSHATLFIIDPSDPLRTLEIRGTVQSSPDADLGVFKAVFDTTARIRTAPACHSKGVSPLLCGRRPLAPTGDHRPRRTVEKRTVN